MKILVFYIISISTILSVSAQEIFKVMFYNLLNYPLEDAVPNREIDLTFILSDYQPDLFLVCELNNSAGANSVLNITRTAINSNFEMATYVSNTSDDTSGDENDLQNLIYYDSTKFILEEQIIVPTALRDFNVYRFKLNTIDQDTNPIELYVVVCHLKASSGTLNAQRRYDMIIELDQYINTLPVDTNVLLGGDLNIYTASEAAFQQLINGTSNITFIDPANRIGSWNNNVSFVDVFTQSTRTQNGLGGATGGFDDRFDFILTSENMLSDANISYVTDSYQVFGNNGLSSCYNSRINSADCGEVGSQFTLETRDALHNFSDHLPVTVSLETDATLLKINEATTTVGFNLDKTVINYTLVIYINSFKLFNEKLIIYNCLGQNVKTLQMNSEYEQHFDVSNLPVGLYYLASHNQNINPLKFIRSH